MKEFSLLVVLLSIGCSFEEGSTSNEDSVPANVPPVESTVERKTDDPAKGKATHKTVQSPSSPPKSAKRKDDPSSHDVPRASDEEWDRLVRTIRVYEETWELENAVQAAERLREVADKSRVDELKVLCHDEDIFVANMAADALAEVEQLAALPMLLEVYERNDVEGFDNDGPGTIITGLVKKHAETAAPIVLTMINSNERTVREHGVWLAGSVAGKIDVDVLLEQLDDEDAKIRSTAVGSLTGFPPSAKIVERLIALLEDPDEQVRVSTTAALGYCRDRRAIPALRRATNDPADRVREFARYALERIENKPLNEDEAE